MATSVSTTIVPTVTAAKITTEPTAVATPAAVAARNTGKIVKSAVDTGFDKALVTIIDTHVTTIVSAAFLYAFGTGAIKGFAVTLTIGLLANLFTAVYVSRTMFIWELNRGGRRAETISI